MKIINARRRSLFKVEMALTERGKKEKEKKIEKRK